MSLLVCVTVVSVTGGFVDLAVDTETEIVVIIVDLGVVPGVIVVVSLLVWVTGRFVDIGVESGTGVVDNMVVLCLALVDIVELEIMVCEVPLLDVTVTVPDLLCPVPEEVCI